MQYVRCIRNLGNPVSLTIGKVYKLLPISDVESQEALIRVIDNEGEDYLYRSDQFEPITFLGQPKYHRVA